MKKIIINSKKHGKHTVLVDDDDFELVSKYKWSVYKGRTTFYCLTSWIKNGNKTTKSMHRMIMKAKSGQEVDHTDHNGLNNTRKNLRLCTDSQNSRNMLKHKNNLSGYKGVSYDKRRESFYSRIRLGDRSRWLGSFSTVIDAAKAYNTAAIKYYGEFAKLNQI